VKKPQANTTVLDERQYIAKTAAEPPPAIPRIPSIAVAPKPASSPAPVINQPVIERTVERVVREVRTEGKSGVDEATLLNALRTEFLQKLSQVGAATV
jgi:hypothetical protein